MELWDCLGQRQGCLLGNAEEKRAPGCAKPGGGLGVASDSVGAGTGGGGELCCFVEKGPCEVRESVSGGALRYCQGLKKGVVGGSIVGATVRPHPPNGSPSTAVSSGCM